MVQALEGCRASHITAATQGQTNYCIRSHLVPRRDPGSSKGSYPVHTVQLTHAP